MTIIFNDKIINKKRWLDEEIAQLALPNDWPKKEIFQKSAVPLPIFQTPFGSISLLYGPRQVGKTASLKLFLSQVDDSETLIFTDCSTILHRRDLYEHLVRQIKGRTTLVLDEVQEVQEWHLALRSLYGEGKLRNARIWCTGSEARHLLESGERLPGRRGEGKNIFARPWSFREYVDFFYPHEVKNYHRLSFQHVTQAWIEEREDELLHQAWKEYAVCGGFPKVVGEYRKNQSISDATFRIYEDWILGSWSTVRTPERSLRSLSSRIVDTLNSRVSYDAMRKGTDIQSPNTVRSLIEIQEDHFALKMIPRYDIHQKRFTPSKLKKIYPLDPFVGHLFNCLGKNISRNYFDRLPEDVNFDELAFFSQTLRREERQDSEVSFLYSENSKSEVDFYLSSCAFELKSSGTPTKSQKELLRQASNSFVVRKEHLPIVAYLVGEGRGKM